VHEGALQAVALIGDVSAESWLKDYLLNQTPVAPLGRALLMPGSNAPSGVVARGRVVCNCLNVAESDIMQTLANIEGSDGVRLLHLQQTLRCGTQCGSCVPELKKMIAAQAPVSFS
jgi:assimilatory nitrate reductase catalytic subunit